MAAARQLDSRGGEDHDAVDSSVPRSRASTSCSARRRKSCTAVPSAGASTGRRRCARAADRRAWEPPRGVGHGITSIRVQDGGGVGADAGADRLRGERTATERGDGTAAGRRPARGTRGRRPPAAGCRPFAPSIPTTTATSRPARSMRPRNRSPRATTTATDGSRATSCGPDRTAHASSDIADLPPQLRSLLSPADGDGDGTASAAELLAAMMAAQGRELGDREPGSAEGPIAPSQGTGTGGGGPQVQMPLMAALDVDQDGMVSETKIESAAQSLRMLDTDGDGRISPDELQPASSSGSSGNAFDARPPSAASPARA